MLLTGVLAADGGLVTKGGDPSSAVISALEPPAAARHVEVDGESVDGGARAVHVVELQSREESTSGQEGVSVEQSVSLYIYIRVTCVGVSSYFAKATAHTMLRGTKS